MYWGWYFKVNLKKKVCLDLDLVFIYLCYGGTQEQNFFSIIVKNAVNTMKKHMLCSFTNNFRVQC